MSDITKDKEIAKPKEKKLSLIESPLTGQQLLTIVQRTPKQHIYTRPAKGGGNWEYVTGVYIQKILNYTFGFLWDFRIIDKGREGDQIWVQGQLTIKDKEGRAIIIKEQFGRADIKFKRNTKEALDYGNDLKSASTDALKKCASELGIASDIYGKNEFRDIQNSAVSNSVPVKKAAVKSNKVDELKKMTPGKTEAEKLAFLNKSFGVNLKSFQLTDTMANRLITALYARNSQQKA